MLKSTKYHKKRKSIIDYLKYKKCVYINDLCEFLKKRTDFWADFDHSSAVMTQYVKLP